MVRNIGADGRTVYRAVITFKDQRRDGKSGTRYEGPYDSVGAARARVSFWRNRMAAYGDGSSAEGHVEQAHTIWAPLDGKEQRPAERAADAIRAQAYRDAADDIDAEYPGPGVDRAARYAAEFLRRRADEIHPATQEPTP